MKYRLITPTVVDYDDAAVPDGFQDAWMRNRLTTQTIGRTRPQRAAVASGGVSR